MSYLMDYLTRRLVALLAEGVDRNVDGRQQLVTSVKSPSSRRAWIEIPNVPTADDTEQVALLAEGVDRNSCFPDISEKRASVALLAEGVDRNSGKGYITQKGWGRPPRGGRG